MKSTVTWKKGMSFEADSRGLKTAIDLPDGGGANTGPNPKELLLSAVAACSAMDVVSLYRKHGIEIESFRITSQGETGSTHPKVFNSIELIYDLRVKDFHRENQLVQALEAVTLSMTKYCGVSAMVAPVSPIFYTVVINGEIELRDEARFS